MGLKPPAKAHGKPLSTASSVAPDITVCPRVANPVALQPGSLGAGVDALADQLRLGAESRCRDDRGQRSLVAPRAHATVSLA